MKNFKSSISSTLDKFGRDKRTRTVTAERVERESSKPEHGSSSREHSSEFTPRSRTSFNPNFTPDNKPKRSSDDSYGGSRGGSSRYGGNSNGGDSSRKSYNDRDNRNNGDRPSFGQRGNREEGDRPSFGQRNNNDRPSFGQRGNREEGGNRPSFSRRGNGDRPSFGQRNNNDRPSFGQRGNREEGDSTSSRGEYSPRPYGGNKPSKFGGKSDSKFGKRPYGGGNSRYGSQEQSERPKRDYDKPRSYDRARSADSANRDKPRSYPKYDPNKQTGAVRLNRFIAQSGTCSRREADDFITAGVVSVNGVIVTELGTKVMPTDEVKFNDSKLQGEKKVYLVLNKPKGYVTTLDDPHADKTVLDLVKNVCDERIYPVGRLDKNSMGLLIFTNDGDLTRQLTHPSYRKKKIYQVSLDKPLTRADMDSLAEGITLEDGDIFADEISYVKDDKTEVGVEIHSGRNRIVRRMFEHLGYAVQKLDRVYYAGLTKKNLKRGGWRFLTKDEVMHLKTGQYE